MAVNFDLERSVFQEMFDGLTERSSLSLHKIFCHWSIIRGRHVVSYAFVMSRTTSPKAWLLSKDFDMSFCIS